MSTIKAQMCMKIKIVYGGFYMMLITLILNVSCSIGDSTLKINHKVKQNLELRILLLPLG